MTLGTHGAAAAENADTSSIPSLETEGALEDVSPTAYDEKNVGESPSVAITTAAVEKIATPTAPTSAAPVSSK